ncbi:MAG: (2Fe-2S) ferredoxin domain-containing protein [Bacillota bacterium]
MKTLAELKALKERASKDLALREQTDAQRIVVGMGTCGIAAGAREVMLSILDELGKRNMSKVTVGQTGCVGLCAQEPIIDVMVPGQGRVTYTKVDEQRARRIIAEHVVNGHVCLDWALNVKDEPRT